jgi:hypothetical protein
MQLNCIDQEEQEGQLPVITKLPLDGVKFSGSS